VCAEWDFLKDYVNGISVLEICPSQQETSYNCSSLMRLATDCDLNNLMHLSG